MQPPKSLEDYMRRREIPREPDAPELSESEIDEISRVVFVSPSPKPSDLLFVFGSSDGRWELVASLFERHFAPVVLVTGRAGEDFYATGQPQAQQIRAALLSLCVPDEAIITEDQSNNTLENVRYGKATLDRNHVATESILFVCKSHHTGRAWRTLAAIFPAVRLSCASYDAIYDGMPVESKNWWRHDVSRKRVYGEFQRIQLYAARGDIAIHGPEQIA